VHIIDQCVIIEDLGAKGSDILKKIERAGRTCYKSEDKITDESSEAFVRSIIKRGHESVLEHHNITLRFITDRGVSHEIVRHRLASYSQESTRYCDYSKKDMEFIRQVDFEFRDSERYVLELIEERYNEMLQVGATPQQARSILPNCLKTEIVVTMNLRAWRHFFKLRTAPAAHPQMRALAKEALRILKVFVPVIFEDIN
jgi:thymidylate synthase (FAD)